MENRKIEFNEIEMKDIFYGHWLYYIGFWIGGFLVGVGVGGYFL